MVAGISFGFAEAISNVLAGVAIKYIKDTHTLFGCFGLSFICQTVFYFSGGNEGGTVAFVALFINMLGIGGAFVVIFFMVDQRIPSEKSGSAMVIVITASFIYSSVAPFVAYAEQPTPYITGMILLILSIIFTFQVSTAPS